MQAFGEIIVEEENKESTVTIHETENEGEEAMDFEDDSIVELSANRESNLMNEDYVAFESTQ